MDAIVMRNVTMGKIKRCLLTRDIEATVDDYDRIYFGEEFCERLISFESYKKAIDKHKNSRIDISIVTPVCTDIGISILEKTFAYIEKILPHCEIIVNDYGVLNLVRRYNLQPIIGRVLSRQRRGIHSKFISTELALKYLKSSAYPMNAHLLRNLGIKRVEIDNLSQGLENEDEFNRSIHYPLSYITITRNCKIANSDSISNKLDYCNKECDKYQIKMYNENIPEMIMIGNAIFKKIEELPKIKYDRIIIPYSLISTSKKCLQYST
jgi:hypothetical protein